MTFKNQYTKIMIKAYKQFKFVSCIIYKNTVPSSSSWSWFVEWLLLGRLFSQGGQSSSNVPLSVIELSSHFAKLLFSSVVGDSWRFGFEAIKEFKFNVSGKVTLKLKV